MRRVLQVVLTASCCVATGVCAGLAQRQRSRAPVVARPQPVVVWLVVPGTDADRLRIARQKTIKQMHAGQALPTTVQEQTAGSFGRASSDVGQTAGSYGQTSSSAGTNASDTGQTAGSYGTTAGSFGRASSDVGQTAGSYGQTSSTYGQTLGGTDLLPPVPAALTAAQSAQWSMQVLHTVMGDEFPDAAARYAPVVAEELQDKLAAAEGSADYPDVLVGGPLPDWWDGTGMGLAMLGQASFLELAEAQSNHAQSSHGPMQAAILVKAPHPAEARTFVEWLRNVRVCGWPCEVPKLDKHAEEPARIAASALDTLLQGGRLGDMADPEAAKFSAEVARKIALGWFPPEILDALKFQVDVLAADANERLAVVSLRTRVESPHAFGVLHARVILRKSDAGRWKVLQISPGVAAESLESGWTLWRQYTMPGASAKVSGISQAAPPDGDNRPPQPDLWWDNGGGASLLVVEWQMNVGGGWTDTHLMYIPDTDNRVKTRLTATFAAMTGEYRWRVWSVGAGGAMALSPWRRLIVMP